MRRLLPLAVLVVAGCGSGSAAPAAAPQTRQPVGKILQGVASNLAKAAWSGTVVIKDDGQSTNNEATVITQSTSRSELKQVVTITLTNGIATAQIDYALRARSDTVQTYETYVLTGYREDVTTASGNTKDASVKISVYQDGRYEIEYHVDGVQGQYSMVEESRATCKPSVSVCPAPAKNTDSGKINDLGFVADAVTGSWAAVPASGSAPKALSGKWSGPTDNSANISGTRTVNWNLYRKAP